MASITKTAKGYRAQVYVKGSRDSQTFRTKREAEILGLAARAWTPCSASTALGRG